MTINLEVTLFWDHLFLVREGGGIWKSEKFKVVTYERHFEIGSMPGLMTLFSGHSAVLTNFKIFEAESRPY